ncbi:MAG: helix-turn-helix domain-containing protein [Actinomycetota bacterium]|nr:helix-turn-helix domain-containing protein [Actinomycetota bacterium]
MDGLDEAALVAALGANIRQRRKQQGLTATALAAAAGVSQPFLSQVERGRAMPSLLSLHRIARALESTAQELLAASATPAVELRRAGEGRVFSHGTGPESTGAITARWLVSAPRQLGPAEIIAQPGADSGGLAHGEGEELLVVLDGEVEVRLGQGSALRCYLVGPGDALHYPATLWHRWRVPGPVPARFLAITSPATF